MIIQIVFILIGFVFLIKGADYLVDGSSALAKRLKISDLVIGLTIVSFGTSAPELLVNLLASFRGSTDIAIGNVIGSNIANILLILGISGIIYPLTVKKNTTWKEIPFSLLAAIVLFIMANDVLLDGGQISILSRTDGMILIVFFIIFMYYTFGIARSGDIESVDAKKQSIMKSSGAIIVGLVGLILGGQWVVDNAVGLAGSMGISQSFIGLTIVAIGTSLPELFTSAMAAYRHNTDIAIGNVVGSNIFNIFWILGLSSIIKPLPFQIANNIDIGMVVLASLLLFSWMFIGKKHNLDRWQAGAFIVIYIFYIFYLVFRG